MQDMCKVTTVVSCEEKKKKAFCHVCGVFLEHSTNTVLNNFSKKCLKGFQCLPNAIQKNQNEAACLLSKF